MEKKGAKMYGSTGHPETASKHRRFDDLVHLRHEYGLLANHISVARWRLFVQVHKVLAFDFVSVIFEYYGTVGKGAHCQNHSGIELSGSLFR